MPDARRPRPGDRPLFRVAEILVCDGRTCFEVEPYRPGDLPALPLVVGRVEAGFPSPADDYDEEPLDLNARYVRHPEATFFIKAAGTSMVGAGIAHGDTLLVDRALALEAKPGDVVIASVHGQLTVKRLERRGGRLFLVADPGEGEVYPPIAVTEEGEFRLWGVVTLVLKELGRR